jgi:hypothetical protein
MKTKLRMKCKACGQWNRIEVNKLFIEQPTSEPKVKAYIPMYEPLKTETYKKCGQTYQLKQQHNVFAVVNATAKPA